LGGGRKLAALLAAAVVGSTIHAGTLVLECDTTANSYGIGTNVKIPTSCANYTIECWMKPTQTFASGQYNLFGQFASGDGRMLVGYYNGKAGIFNGGGSGWVTGATSLQAGTWHHVAFVIDTNAANTVSIYLDGVLDGSSTARAFAPRDRYFAIGSATAGTPNTTLSSDAALDNRFMPFKGRIADVRVWTIARTQADIAADYQRRLVGNETGLLGYWPLDEIGDNGQTFVEVKTGDRSVLREHFTLVEDNDLVLTPAASRVNGLKRSSFSGRGKYDNTVADAVRGLATDITTSLGNNFTIETWIRPHTRGVNELWLFAQFKPGNGRFVFATQNNKPSFFVGDSTSGHVIAPDELEVGVWTHLALTRSGDTFTIYTNGYAALTHTQANAYLPPATNFCIGSSVYDGTWNGFAKGVGYTYGGSFREVRVWNSCRTGEQIRATMGYELSGTESGLLGYWPLDEGQGTNILNRVTGVACKPVVGDPIWLKTTLPPVERVPGPNTAAVATFTGGCQTGADTGMKLTSSNYTIEAWLRIHGAEHETFSLRYAYVACQTTQSGSVRNMMFGVRGNHAFHLQDGPSNGWLDGATDISHNRWVHLAFVQSGTTRRLYVDGVLDAEVDDGAAYLPTANINLQLGCAHHLPGQARCWGTDGSLADVRLWNCARTAEEIARFRTRRLTGKEPGLVGYWPLDEGTGATLVNHARGGVNGTLSQTVWDTLDDLFFDDPLIPGCTIIFR